jgi:Putative prokaryotic signal transducing protein
MLNESSRNRVCPKIIGCESASIIFLMTSGDSDREYYSAMSDGELLKLAARPWALSDSAWEALEAELDRRGLELPEPATPPTSSALERRNLVLLRRFRDIPEALLAKGLLESMDVECVLADDNMVRMDWFLSNLLGGVKLLVEAEDFTRAAEILNEPMPEHLQVDGVGKYVQPRCPNCGSLDVAFAELNKPVSYTTAWLGMPIPLASDDWQCHACGHHWEEEPSEEWD